MRNNRDHPTRDPDDAEAILSVVLDAFTNRGHDGQEEVDIVEATWSATTAADRFELVTEREGAVIGHVLAASGTLGGRPVLGIAPLCVATAHQGAGIGTALLGELLRRVEAAGHPLVVLLGYPAYYERFGFEPSGPLGVTYQPAGADNPHFMVRRFAGYDPSSRGDFVYCWSRGPRDRGGSF